MDYSEIQLAAIVYKIAGDCKQLASQKEFHDWADRDRDQLPAQRAAWDKANPKINFVPAALELLQLYSDAIKSASSK